MKQPGYTAGVTSVYRKYLDLLFEKGAENYRVAEEDKRYLLDLFNREVPVPVIIRCRMVRP